MPARSGIEVSRGDIGCGRAHPGLFVCEFLRRPPRLDRAAIREIDDYERVSDKTHALRCQRVDGKLEALVGIVLRLRLSGLVVNNADPVAIGPFQAIYSSLHHSPANVGTEKALVVQNLARGLCQVGAQKLPELLAAVLLEKVALRVLLDPCLAELVAKTRDDRLFLRRMPGTHTIEICFEGQVHRRAKLHHGRRLLRDTPVAAELERQRTAFILLDGAGAQLAERSIASCRKLHPLRDQRLWLNRGMQGWDNVGRRQLMTFDGALERGLSGFHQLAQVLWRSRIVFCPANLSAEVKLVLGPRHGNVEQTTLFFRVKQLGWALGGIVLAA